MSNINSYQDGIRPHFESCLYNKVNTFQSVADCLNKKGLRTPRGREFNATAVRRLMLSLDVSF
ncbi:recombinase family protein [Pseudomonas sp. B21-032]|uniref:recombinase family protein n=1 Tax=Pseudomonas sp. B21-032 TaxID=2895483 RepID=UPI002160A7E5|nr:recombinase family protein [Pseudomonas sp. B21-032]UVL63254.1 recombinase family protein [Pseudomonas sp. B21-032]